MAHPKGKWGKAAPEASVSCYVFADLEGNRFSYNDDEKRQEELERYKINQKAYFDLFKNSRADNDAWADATWKKGKRWKTDTEYWEIPKSVSDCPPVKEHKKFDNLGRAKQRALFLVGYYNQFGQDMGMLNNYSPMPPWTKEWYVWSADADGYIIEPVLNCAEYIERTQKYAALSKEFGPELSEVFKKIEKDSSDYESVVVLGKFNGDDIDIDPRFEEDQTYREHDGKFIGEHAGYCFTAPQLASLKQCVPAKSVKKIGKTRAAIAIESLTDAMMFKLKYDGDLDMKIIDVTNLCEYVE